ncbi:hypothetical protein KW805_00990 [Candidatus Pacearchaeota archaeon]|nr:hypothetical protein [Candidatus Pacearchaeota archaeon]
MFKVFTTREFDEDFDKLDGSEKIRVRKFIDQLEEKGGNVGKPLSVPFFREKKFDGKRLYFLFYEDFAVVLAVALSDKKAQQATINEILNNLDTYQDYVFKLLREFKP